MFDSAGVRPHSANQGMSIRLKSGFLKMPFFVNSMSASVKWAE